MSPCSTVVSCPPARRPGADARDRRDRAGQDAYRGFARPAGSPGRRGAAKAACAAAALGAALAAPSGVFAASLQIGELDDAGGLMRPRVALVGIAYSNRADARRAAFGPATGLRMEGEARPVAVESEPAPAPACQAPRFGMPGVGGSGLRCLPAVQGQGLTSPDEDARGVALQPSSTVAVEAPRLLPAGTDVSVKFGRLAPDPAAPAASGHEVVMLASLRHAIWSGQTLTATALRVGPAMLVAAAADWRLGWVGLLRGGVGLMDRGEGALARSLVGHEFTWDRLVTTLRWERSHLVDGAGGGISPVLSGAALGVLPSDTTQVDAKASYRLNHSTQLQLAANSQQALGGGPGAQSVSFGSSTVASADSRWGLALENSRQPFLPDQRRLWVTWQIDLGGGDDPMRRTP